MTDEPNTRPPSERPVAQMREALEPFAKAADSLERFADTAKPFGTLMFSVGDFRRARAALTAERPEAAVACPLVNEISIAGWLRIEGGRLLTAEEKQAIVSALLAIQHEEPGRETDPSLLGRESVREETIEECAKIAEAFAKRFSGRLPEASDAGIDIAEDIRSLSPLKE